MRNSHRKVTFEMSENQEMFENRSSDDGVDILWYQDGSEKINKAIQNII